MHTIAEQLNVKTFPLRLFDAQKNEIYSETPEGNWVKMKYDEAGNRIYYEASFGYWYKKEYDKNNKIIQWEDSTSSWFKQEFDESGKQIYYECVGGVMIDKRTKPIQEVTMSDIEAKFGCIVKIIRGD